MVSDDAKAIITKESNIVDLNGKVLMPGLVMLHEHMYISAHSITPRYPNLKQFVSFPKNRTIKGCCEIGLL